MTAIDRKELREAALSLLVAEIQVREAMTPAYRDERAQFLWAQVDLLARMAGNYQLAAPILRAVIATVDTHLGPDDHYDGSGPWKASDPDWRRTVAERMFLALDELINHTPAHTP